MADFEKAIIKSGKNILITLLIFSLFVIYAVGNFFTVIYYCGLYDRFWDYLIEKYGRDKGLDIFFFCDDVGWIFNKSHRNQIFAVIVILMIFADMFFGIRNGRKSVVKWVGYGIITIIILFIAFVASPVFIEYMESECV